MIRVIVADDHDLIREGIKKILKKESDIHIVGETQRGSEVLDLLTAHPTDVLLLDISMPGISGLDLIKDVRARFRKTAILMLSMHPESRFAIRALRSGASGYLTKEHAGEQLAKAIRRIATGGKYITDDLAEQLAEELNHPEDRPPHASLSDREFQVFLLLAGGRSVGAIAGDLNLGVTTISTYRARILEKMGASTNADLTQYAYSHKLIE